MEHIETGNKLIEDAGFEVEPCPPASPTSDRRVAARVQQKGLTNLGKVFVTKLMDKGILIDIDHAVLSIHQGYLLPGDRARQLPAHGGPRASSPTCTRPTSAVERMRSAAQLEKLSARRSGVGHDANERKNHPRCLNSSLTFKDDYEYAVGKLGGVNAASVPFGSDFSGVAPHVGPRFGDSACGNDAKNKASERSRPRLAYPFTIPGFGRFEKQVTGQRTFDFNVDGLAHIGLLPDLIADLSREGTNLGPLFRSAAGYVASWRKAVAASTVKVPPTISSPLPIFHRPIKPQ